MKYMNILDLDGYSIALFYLIDLLNLSSTIALTNKEKEALKHFKHLHDVLSNFGESGQEKVEQAIKDVEHLTFVFDEEVNNIFSQRPV